ncbi:MAG: HAD-IIIA family hydrolase [Candidatus Latescibacteria bacterium]|nr:HAD-IIIA family hydrolase [Candidatus Latescibacterota bacterium]
MGKVPAIFLDRDGTIIEDRGHLRSKDEVHFYPETFLSLRKLQKHFVLFIVTHQPGVSRRLITMNEVETINTFISDTLKENGIIIKEIYVCPHDKSEMCRCIKPLPYFLLQASKKYNIDLKKSYTIGDHPHDVELAHNAGTKGIYVLTGHGTHHIDELPEGTIIANNIEAATDFIIENMI